MIRGFAGDDSPLLSFSGHESVHGLVKVTNL